jgi:hypothetical protein
VISIFGFLNKVLSSKSRDLFAVQLGATLFMAKLGIVGWPAQILGGFVRGFIGLLMDTAIYNIDLALDSFKEGQKLEEFKVAATAAYIKATARVYSEEEKQKIRDEYKRIISRIGVVGAGPK